MPIAEKYCRSLMAHASCMASASSVAVSIYPVDARNTMLGTARESVRVNAELVPHDNAGNRWGGMNVRVVTEYVCLECMRRTTK